VCTLITVHCVVQIVCVVHIVYIHPYMYVGAQLKKMETIISDNGDNEVSLKAWR